MKKQPISAVIIVKNEASIIRKCIEGVMPLCEQVLVVDTGSTDNTIEIARAVGADVMEISWQGFGHARNVGIQAAKYDWIFSPDADEIPDETLIRSISQLDLQDRCIYKMNRLTSLNGKWIRHCNWHPDWINRLYQKKHSTWSLDAIHEHLIFSHPVKYIKLEGKLLHYSFPTYESHQIKMEKYALLGAQKLYNKRVKPSLYRSYLKPLIKFLKTVTIHRSFLDGPEGWYIAKANYALKKKEAAHLQDLWSKNQ